MASSTIEYKDNRDEWRLRHTHENGNITLTSSEGYKNRKDLRTSMINSAIEVLEFYCGKEKNLKEHLKSKGLWEKKKL